MQHAIGRLAIPLLVGLLLALAWFGPIFATRPHAAETGKASWYQCCNPMTACNVPFRPGGVSIAHRTLRCGTKVRITDLATGRSIVAVVLDRGPFIRGRIADLTRGAATALGMRHRGVVRVRLEVIR